jgi:hypothetical protein
VIEEAAAPLETVTTDLAADGHDAHPDAADTVVLVPSNGQPIPNGEAVTAGRRAAKKTTEPRVPATPSATAGAPAAKKTTAVKRTSRTTK